MKIYGTFKDINDDTISLTIYNINKTGPDIDIDNCDWIRFVGDEPIIIETDCEDSFTHIIKKQCTIKLLTRRWMGDYLFAYDATSIIVNVWRTVNNVKKCLFAGYVTPNTYNQDYAAAWEPITITCIDNLGVLEYKKQNDNESWTDLKADAQMRTFKYLMGEMDLDNTVYVIDNLPDSTAYSQQVNKLWIETGFERDVDPENNIHYYVIYSEATMLDSGTAVLTGRTMIGPELTPTYIDSEETTIYDGQLYYKAYAWVTINGEQVNTGDWIIGSSATELVPTVVGQENVLIGWTYGALPQPFFYYDHYRIDTVMSDGAIKYGDSDTIGDQIPEEPNVTSEGSYFHFVQSDNDDLIYEDDGDIAYYKNYAWVYCNNIDDKTGDYVQGNEKYHKTGTRTEITGWMFDTPPIAFNYYEQVSRYNVYSDGHETFDTYLMGHTIPLTPNTTPNGSYYYFQQGPSYDFDYDSVNDTYYYKDYAYVIVNNIAEYSGNWRRGNELEFSFIYGEMQDKNEDDEPINETAPVLTINGTNYTADEYDTTTKRFAFTNTPKTINSLDLNSGGLFTSYNKYKNLYFVNVDTSGLTSLDNMFENQRFLDYLDLSDFDTSNVTSMQYTFVNYSPVMADVGLVPGTLTVDLTNFNTSYVTSMEGMFKHSGAYTLDLSSFDTSNVTNMYRMFDRCRRLTYVDLSSFETTYTTDMKYMFNECINLTSLDLSGFAPSVDVETAWMFAGCTSLTYLNLSNFNVAEYGGGGGGYYRTFYDCPLSYLTLNNVSYTTFDRIACDTSALSHDCTIYRDGITYLYNENTYKWEAQ